MAFSIPCSIGRVYGFEGAAPDVGQWRPRYIAATNQGAKSRHTVTDLCLHLAVLFDNQPAHIEIRRTGI